MKDLTRMTAAELVELHNAKADASARIDGPWKRSKAELIERIHALGGAEADDREPAVAEEAAASDVEPKATGRVSGSPGTVRALAEALLAGADASAPLTYEEIAGRIREAIPGSAPTPQSIRWYATKMRKRGETVRVRYASRKAAAP